MANSRILVADDDRDIRELVEFKLVQAGYEVVTAEDGPQALTAVRSEPFDLVVLDVMMPQMTGIEVCRTLRAEHKTATLPVILLTAKAQAADMQAGLAAGANDYLTKPFSLRDLSNRVDAALTGAS